MWLVAGTRCSTTTAAEDDGAGEDDGEDEDGDEGEDEGEEGSKMLQLAATCCNFGLAGHFSFTPFLIRSCH